MDRRQAIEEVIADAQDAYAVVRAVAHEVRRVVHLRREKATQRRVIMHLRIPGTILVGPRGTRMRRGGQGGGQPATENLIHHRQRMLCQKKVHNSFSVMHSCSFQESCRGLRWAFRITLGQCEVVYI